MASRPIIAVVDDDESVRESLPPLLRSYGLEVLPFSSAEQFLAAGRFERISCLILDVGLPGMSGLELQKELARQRIGLPIVFITAHRRDELGTQMAGSGAVACLPKPFSEAAIITAVRAAIATRNTDATSPH
jgi:FixJ family two-component response regulator